MANSLGINLDVGQKIIMQGFGSEQQRTVTANGGFGMTAFTSGTALFVKTASGNDIRVNSMEIERLAD